MKRECNQCSRTYTAKLQSSLYCSNVCRARASKLKAAAPSPPAGRMPHLPVAGGGVSLYDAAYAEFAARGVAGSLPAMQALQAAQRLDDASTADASRSPLSREFSRLREEALRGAVQADDPLEILRQRVQAKRNDDDEAYAHWMARWEALPPSVRNPGPR